jgi:hypothetical protein
MNTSKNRKELFIPTLAAFLILISLLGCGKSTSTRVRLVNASPDSNGLEVLLDSSTTGAVTGVTFGTASKYVSLSAGAHAVQVKDPNAGSAPPVQNLNFTSGTDTTLLAASSYATLNIVELTDDNKAPTTGDVKIRVVHTAQSLGTVDVYIVAPGTDLGTVSPTYPSVAFEGATAYKEVAAGSYEVYITQPNQKFYYIDSGPLTLTAGQIRTVVALDNVAGNGYTAAVLADVN